MRQVVVVVVLLSVLGQLLCQLRGGLRVHIHEDGSIASSSYNQLYHFNHYHSSCLDLKATDARKVRKALNEAVEFWRLS